MTTKKEPKASMTKEKSSLKCEDLEKALDTLNDYFDRASCQFILLGETGHAVYYEEGLCGQRLEIGVKPEQLSQYAVSTLNQLITGFGTALDRLGFNIGTIPVELTILKRNADVFKYPDSKYYGHEIYLVPNPFVKYYKNREYFE